MTATAIERARQAIAWARSNSATTVVTDARAALAAALSVTGGGLNEATAIAAEAIAILDAHVDIAGAP